MGSSFASQLTFMLFKKRKHVFIQYVLQKGLLNCLCFFFYNGIGLFASWNWFIEEKQHLLLGHFISLVQISFVWLLQGLVLLS